MADVAYQEVYGKNAVEARKPLIDTFQQTGTGDAPQQPRRYSIPRGPSGFVRSFALALSSQPETTLSLPDPTAPRWLTRGLKKTVAYAILP